LSGQASQLTALVLLLVASLGLSCCRSPMKLVMAVATMEWGVLLLAVSLGHVEGGVAPILPLSGRAANPLPQAFALTAVVIGASTVALALALAARAQRAEEDRESPEGEDRGRRR